MNLETLFARILPLAVLAAAIAAFAGVLALAALPAKASVGPRDSSVPAISPEHDPIAAARDTQIGPTLSEPPRCSLEVTQESYRDGDIVRASLHLSNPTPASAEVEMKIWFSAPGEPPLSLADPLESGSTLELPAMLNRDSGNLRLFSVDESTPRGTYEMNCRLIDPVTGAMLSEDLNAFSVQ